MPDMMPRESVLTPEARQRLLEALLAHAESQGARVRERGSSRRHGGGYMDHTTKEIGMTPGYGQTDQGLSTLAHEIGHAEISNSTLGALIQNPVTSTAARAAPLIGALIGLTAEGNFARRLALSTGTVAALNAPMLLSEAGASIKGHRMLKEHGAPQEMLDLHRDKMLPAFGSYLRHITAPGLATAAAGTALSSAFRTHTR